MMDIIPSKSDEIQTEFTAGQILGYMAQGAFYAAIVLCALAGFVIVFWVIGRLLPPEEAYFSAVEQTLRAFA